MRPGREEQTADLVRRADAVEALRLRRRLGRAGYLLALLTDPPGPQGGSRVRPARALPFPQRALRPA
jgi:hypothetical protein